MDKNERFYKFYHYANKLNYMIWLLEANLIFLGTNLPFVLVLILVPITLGNIPFYVLSSITVIPSLYCLTKTLVQLRSGQENVVRNYLNHFKSGFLPLLKKSLPFFLLIWLILSNLVIINNVMKNQFLYWTNFILLYIVCTFLLNHIIVEATWDQPFMDAVRLTAKLGIVRSLRTQLGAMIAVGSFFLFKYVPVYLVLYGISTTIFLCLLNFQPVVEFVESREENQL